MDLEQDPMELVSRHDDPAYQQILKTVKERYWQARERYEIPDEYGPGGQF